VSDSEFPVQNWPYHYRDNGEWCGWSNVQHRGTGACPNGCAGSLEHYANDGHDECAEAGESA
jgi:hypothetical protein